MTSEHTVECPHPGHYLGMDASFEQKIIFEWAYLRVVFEKSGDDQTATYCQSKIDGLIKSEFG